MSAEHEILRLIEIVKRLRAKDGCPWDRDQTHESLKPYLLEETYELLESIDLADHRMLCEELGDVLLHIVMHSEMASETGQFALDDVIRGVSEKMVRRHPHVFGDVKVSSVKEVWETWDKVKKDERKHGSSVSIMDSVPQNLPALIRSDRLQKRAARIGFDWDSVAGAWDKVHEEIREIEEIMTSTNDESQLAEELGDLLFSVVNVTRKLDIDAEEVLRQSNKKFMRRFKYLEQAAHERGLDLKHLNSEQLEALWVEAKNNLKRS